MGFWGTEPFMAREKDKRSKGRKAGRGKFAKKAVAAKAVGKRAPGGAKLVESAKKIAPRKPVPIKTARVGKRALLPPLPPPPAVLVTPTHSPVRRASRLKALLRNKGAVKASPAVSEIVTCTEAGLREKLRIAAPYVALWLARRDREETGFDGTTPEAAFVRLWQWLMLEAMLEDRRTVTLDLLDRLLSEEIGRAP